MPHFSNREFTGTFSGAGNFNNVNDDCTFRVTLSGDVTFVLDHNPDGSVTGIVSVSGSYNSTPTGGGNCEATSDSFSGSAAVNGTTASIRVNVNEFINVRFSGSINSDSTGLTGSAVITFDNTTGQASSQVIAVAEEAISPGTNLPSSPIPVEAEWNALDIIQQVQFESPIIERTSEGSYEIPVPGTVTKGIEWLQANTLPIMEKETSAAFWNKATGYLDDLGHRYGLVNLGQKIKLQLDLKDALIKFGTEKLQIVQRAFDQVLNDNINPGLIENLNENSNERLENFISESDPNANIVLKMFKALSNMQFGRTEENSFRFTIAYPGEEFDGGDLDDALQGGNLSDTIRGNGGNDIIFGLGGNDVLSGGSGRDFIFGGNGADALTGGAGNDQLDGGGSSDVLIGDDGNDRLDGGGGMDVMNGDDGDDILRGGGGMDVQNGGGGNDTLKGGNDDDMLDGNAGADVLKGQYGNDKLIFSDDFIGDISSSAIHGGSPNEPGTGETFSLSGMRLSGDKYIGGPGIDKLLGNDTKNDAILLDDGLGKKLINGIEIIKSNGGDDLIDLTSGQFNYGNVKVFGGEGNDTIWTSEGNDTIRGEAGNDTVLGWLGNDKLIGGSGNDILNGGNGKDLIKGNDDNDMLYGDAGADTLFGGGGNDFLNGGAGKDILKGGSGADSFIFDTDLAQAKVDTIDQFISGEDRIVLDDDIFTTLSTLAGNTLNTDEFRANTNGIAKDADDRIIYSTATGKLFYDADGDGPETAIKIAFFSDAPAIDENDFLVTS